MYFLQFIFIDMQTSNNYLELDRINQPWPADPILFYPKEFYVFDNYSSFQVEYKGKLYPTSEHAYQAAKFLDSHPEIAEQIRLSRSAHDAQVIATTHKSSRPGNRDEHKLEIMKAILLCKVDQHEYVKRKLVASGDREIIEDSWRDSERWRWPHKDGKNKLGKLRMEIRSEIVSH